MIQKVNDYGEATLFNERVHRIISAVLVSLMMAAAGLTIAQFGHQIALNWNGWYLPLIGFLVALERFYSHRAIKKLSVLSREWFVLISTEWVVNLIAIKLIVTLSNGLNTLLAQLPLWQKSFSASFFDAPFLVAIMFAIMVWFVVGIITELLDEMGLNSALIAREVLSSFTQGYGPPRKRLMATVFAIGGVLMFFTALARIDSRALFANEAGIFRSDLSPLEGGGAGTLLYFLFGLSLLSQAKYITLNTRWFLQGVPVNRSMAKNWAIYSVSFLLLIMLIVSFLPTSYSLGLLSVLGYLIDIIFGIMIFATSIVLAVLGFLVSLPFLLFGLDSPVGMPAEIQSPPVATPPPVTESTPLPWLDLLKSVLFWGIFLTVIGYSIAQYLRQHEDVLASLRKIPGWKLLAGFWHWITGIFGGFNRRMSKAIKDRRSRSRSKAASANIRGFGRFTRLRNLSPRQRVFFYYHALLRRGDETGLPRRESQTPEEYAASLERSLPTVDDEIASFTDAFNEARYSRHTVEAKDANTVKSYWEKIRRVFRGRRG